MRPVVFEGGMFTSDPSCIEQFTPTKAVATCYMVCNGKILLLKRNGSVTAAGRWCMPGGKLEQNETALEAIIREVEEETAILLPSVAVTFIQTISIRLFTEKTKEDYWLHLFKTILPGSQPSDYPVILNQEHTDYLWADLAMAQQLNLVAGGRQVLDYMYHVASW